VRLCQFHNGRIGLVQGETVRDVTACLEQLPPQRYPYAHGDALIAALPHLAPLLPQLAVDAAAIPLSQVRLASPVANPSKIIGAPVNYRRHLEEVRADPALHHRQQIEEIERIGLFLKATSSLIGPAEAIRIRHPERRTDHEVELAVIIGTECDRVSREAALRCVAGYCIGLDITVRGPEERSLRKSLDTYTVLGPWMVTAEELGDPSDLALSLAVDGEVRQSARTSELILDVPALIAFATSFYRLLPGDVILTGTPAGVGPLVAGNRLRATIERIGSMTVPVTAG
jgi:2-keto-4-pentenoate hydratase/2-oxohepta-3-ene-1,7-dioic acid hydratase in catechol pathway